MLCVYVDAMTGFLQEVCDTVLACLLVFCLEILVKEVFQDLSQWKVHLVIVHVYNYSCLHTPTSIVHLLSNGQ